MKYHSEKELFGDRTIIYDEHGIKLAMAKRHSLGIISISMIQKEIRLADKKNHSLEIMSMSMTQEGIRLEKAIRPSGVPGQIIIVKLLLLIKVKNLSPIPLMIVIHSQLVPFQEK